MTTTDNPGIAEMHRILAAQKKAAIAEGTPSLELRYDRLDRLAALLLGHAEKIAAAISEDFGGRSREATLIYDVAAVLGAIKHTRDHIAAWSQPEIHPSPIPGSEARVEFQPKGVVGIVSPWNFPAQLAFAPLAGIFGAGNRAMLKPSELTPATSELFKRLVAEAFDETELAVVTGGPDIGAAFTALAFDHLIFTGGTAIGRHVARAAADNLTPLTLELGGKSPVIVGASANLQQTVERIMAAKTANAGQICLAPDYVFVPEALEDAFVEAARTAVATMFPALKDNPDYTSIINERHFDRLQGLLSDAREKGATVIELNPANEDFSQRSAHRLPPCIVLNTTEDMRIRQEEIFGPLLPLVRYSALDEAIDYINARARPLALYYFGAEAQEERRVLDSTVSGGVTVNDCLGHVGVDDLPFGGIGEAGMGAYHGRYGFLTFSHAKAVYRQADNSPREALLRPPFQEPVRQFLAQALQRSQ